MEAVVRMVTEYESFEVTRLQEGVCEQILIFLRQCFLLLSKIFVKQCG